MDDYTVDPNCNKTAAQLLEELAEMDPEMLLADGFEEAVIGYVTIFNKTVALYDRAKCLNVLMTRDGMEFQDAVEFFDYNVTGAWVGELTPAFATILRHPTCGSL